MIEPRLGVYWAPKHDQREHRDYMAAINGPIRILEPDVQHVVDAAQLTSDEIWPRLWRIDDNDFQVVKDMMVDPAGSGVRLARALIAEVEKMEAQARARDLPFPTRDRLWLSGMNEPPVWVIEQRVAFVKHEVAFLDTLTDLGWQGLAMRLGVGHPADLDENKRVIWDPYEPIYHAIKRGGHRLELHEYNYWTGPQDGWGWYVGRHHKCPWDVRIVIGEAGVDNYVDAARWETEKHRARGWVGNITPQQYVAQFDYYFDHADDRVEVILPYLSDYQAKEWWSFDLLGAYGEMTAWWRARRAAYVETPDVPDVPVEDIPSKHRTYIPVVRTVVKSGDVVAGQDYPATPMIPDLDVILGGMAKVIGVDRRLPKAFLMAESGGVVRAPDMIVRFEPHIFRQRVERWQFDEWFRVGAPEWNGEFHTVRLADGSWSTYHGNQGLEYYALEVALKINAHAAYESLAMGAGQIMGFHYATVGYASPQSMFDAYNHPDQGRFNQVVGFFAYCMSRDKMRLAMQALDYRKMAELYNGTGQVDLYAGIIRKWMDRL